MYSTWVFLVAAAAFAQPPYPNAHPPRPGSINYVEGQASIGANTVVPDAVGVLEVDRNQVLTTQAGKVEILLAPGIFLRLADNSSLTMVSPDLANVVVDLTKGRAIVEAIDFHKENSVQIRQNGAFTQIRKKGLYDFDAERGEVRVVKGSAEVTLMRSKVKLGKNHKTVIGGELKSVSFERRQYEDEFYRWCGLRSGYVAEASVDAAASYLGTGPGWYGPGWTGFGWYWSPWWGVYTFLPPDGIYYGPFGWGFYSPIAVYRSPYIFYGHNPHGFGNFHYPYGHGLPPTPRPPARGRSGPRR